MNRILLLSLLGRIFFAEKEDLAEAFPVPSVPVLVGPTRTNPRILSASKRTCHHHRSSLSRHHAMGLGDYFVSSSSAAISSDHYSSSWIADADAVISAASASVGDVGGAAANDPLVLGALGVAILALVGVIVLPAQEEPSSSSSSTATTAEASKSVKDEEASKILKATVDGEEDDPMKKIEIEQDTLAFRGDGEMTDDEWVEQGRDAVEALEKQDRGKLRRVVGGLLGSIRTTQRKLRQERVLRETAEADLKLVGEKFRDLEDQYELEQNQLQKTTRVLTETQSQLATTTRKLDETSSALNELQEERKSLRKLGKVAWSLSKDRVQNRVQKVRDRFRRGGSAADDDESQTKSS